MDLLDNLPPTACDIADIIGLDGLLRLVEHYGGIEIRIPGRGELQHVLTPEQYKIFVHTFRNEKLFIPTLKAQKERLIKLEETYQLAQQGLTRTATARKLGITERTVYNRLATYNDKHYVNVN